MPERAGHAERDPTDYYATTPALARLVAERVREDYGLTPRRVLEPGCGTGSFLQAIRQTWARAAIHGVEIHQDLASFSRARGFDVTLADLLLGEWGRFDLCIGNPPFRFSEAFIHHLRSHLSTRGLLVMLLRLNFLEGQERYETLWSKWRPERVYPLSGRPGFTADGSKDATGYGIYVWSREPEPETTVRWIDTSGVQIRWNGTPERVDKDGRVTRAAVLDPAYPDPRKLPVPDRARVGEGLSVLEYGPLARRVGQTSLVEDYT